MFGVIYLVLPHYFGISVDEYVERGMNNDFPEIERCPHCKGRIRLARHGFYWRNVITAAKQYRLPICRLVCPSCRKTVSLLPSFLLPYFQYTVDVILEKLHKSLVYGKITGCHQLVLFYRKRFIKNLNRIEMFFRDTGFLGVLPQETKEKAIRLLEMLRTLGKATLPGRANGHFASNFMAN